MPAHQTTTTRKPLRPCWNRACAALTTDGACASHPRPSYGWKPDRERGSRQERGYGLAWERTRAMVLKRDHYLCQVCRLRSAEAVDHIRPKARGGSDELDNLQAICGPCHRAKTASESRT